MDEVPWTPIGFLVANAVMLFCIIRAKQKRSVPPKYVPATMAQQTPLQAGAILEWEYEYVRNTASEAMQDRHTMINFYLVLVGVVISGVLANLDKLAKWPGGATFLIWVVCVIGWFHFLILVRLREAWYDSLQALLRIRDFSIEHADISAERLKEAFIWQWETLPRAGKRWSVFHYSALLIAFLDSIAFWVGAQLLSKGVATPCSTVVLAVLSILFFGFHEYVYYALLKEKS